MTNFNGNEFDDFGSQFDDNFELDKSLESTDGGFASEDEVDPNELIAESMRYSEIDDDDTPGSDEDTNHHGQTVNRDEEHAQNIENNNRDSYENNSYNSQNNYSSGENESNYQSYDSQNQVGAHRASNNNGQSGMGATRYSENEHSNADPVNNHMMDNHNLSAEYNSNIPPASSYESYENIKEAPRGDNYPTTNNTVEGNDSPNASVNTQEYNYSNGGNSYGDGNYSNMNSQSNTSPVREEPLEQSNSNQHVNTQPRITIPNNATELNRVNIIINIVGAYRKLTDEEKNVVGQFINNGSPINGEAEFVISVLNVDRMLARTIIALREAKGKEPVERAFYIIELDDDVLYALGSLVEVFTNESIPTNMTKIQFARELVKGIDVLDKTSMRFVEATETILRVVEA